MTPIDPVRGGAARLRAEIARDAGVIEALGREITSLADNLTSETDPGGTAYAAVRIHRFYTAIENILLRIERFFAAEPTGGDWHADLLAGAVLPLPDVRPPILPPEAEAPLREVLRFRHFFRHAYAVELDAGRLRAVAERVAEATPLVAGGLSAFDAFLDRATGGAAG